jgi:lipopolysaccharide/colanic/teichoic acid biosynthesis glycosyltransferase
MTELKLLPNYFQNLGPGFELEAIGGIPTMGGGRLPLNRIINRLMKRVTDLTIAGICLIISLPFLLLMGALIYFASPGPIFYRQRRFGRNGKPFNVIKIRTRRLEAPQEVEVGGSKGAGDLQIGVFMRQWHIDDIPQFWNVLMGEMSLVGPRPERPDLTAILKYEIAHYNSRHNVRPGMTGWAQVNGRRGNKAPGESLLHDLWYLENWSVFLDLKIILMTSFRLKDAE